ncbi:xylose isomerase [Candidatus Desantisbacteria bacterium CG1_02_38_46]|uniref:Xylose isomerase n=2 Tax=unclassified Candidatus Desantisiibacteriota TaxID=3106372 RepID=A0A1J4SAS2_9BACT|nr:MAG: xylose isomerase [Candidatus Desantisbacteria bacterium CG1_02_38_46]PIU52269.1 MAG: sugar phosphate isomerase/epimerase [Candidatus Desantisbacteria bacterium CG07_land_8_20_14_0_80_39_15]
MTKSKIGVQLYTLRDYTKTPSDIAQTLKKVREMGYEVVEVSALGPIDPKELRKILNSEGLYACSTHAGYDTIVKETGKVIEEHKILGAPHVVCPGLPGELHNADGYKKVAQELTRAGEILNKEKLILSYHNHGIEFEKYAEVGSVRGDKLGIEILFGESDPRYLKAELDTYWVQYGGADPAQWCLKLKNRLPLLHCKDMGIKENKPIMMEVGEGNLNWKAIFEVCKKAGVEWYLVEQDICQRDPFESLKISLDNMKKMNLM